MMKKILIKNRCTPLFWLSMVAAVSACAPLPALGPVADAKAPEAFLSEQTFKAPEATWPADRWWQKYNDPQLNQLIEEGLADAPDLKAAQARLRRSEAQSQSVGSVLYPQISANGTVFGQEASTNYIVPAPFTPQGWYSYGQATLNFNWEIDFWGKNRAALAAAVSESQARRAEYDENVANYEKTLIQALNEVADVSAGLQQLQKQVRLADQSVAAQTQGLMVAANRYKGGLANYLDVLIAEDELLSSWRVQTDVRTRAFILDVALIKALGGGYQIDPVAVRLEEKKSEELPQ